MKRRQILFFLFPLLFLFSLAQQNPPAASAPPPPDAAEIRADIQKVDAALPKITDRGAALFFLAKRYTALGEGEKALAALKECIKLNEGFDPAESPALKPLRSDPEFQRLVDEVRRHYPSVHRAKVAYTVEEKDLFPEGLAYDPYKHVFYMGSMHRRKIVMVSQSGKVSDFVKPVYNLLEVGGVHVDLADHTVWAATDHDGASELVHFDAGGKLLERFPATDPGPHVLNDLVIRGSAEIYVTDTLAHLVYRFDRKLHTLTAMTFHRPLFYPNGIDLSSNGNRLYVADLMGVIRVDLRNFSSQDVDPGKGSTLAGLDGMYWYQNSLVGVQYGTGSFRVARWRLAPDGVHVISTQLLEYRTPLISFPTTGAIAEGKFYFIANTGIGNLDHDRIIDPAKLEPINIAVLPLK